VTCDRTVVDTLRLLCTGAFPFWRRGDERANSIVRLQQIFPRILAADYSSPPASPVSAKP
jgi:hypothetical protein